MATEPSFKIEKGVPTPRGRLERKYPFKEMAVGDCFYHPDASATTRGGLYSIAKRDGVKIAIRTEGDGFRIWRIA